MERLGSYQVALDATTTDPGNLRGGVGQVTFDGYVGDLGTVQTISDPYHGAITARIRNHTTTDLGLPSVTGDSPLIDLNVYRVTRPFHGTIQAFFDGLGVGTFIVEAPAASQEVTAPGAAGNLWDYIREFLAAHSLELVLDGPAYRVRAIRSLSLSKSEFDSLTFNQSIEDAAQQVVIHYYNHRWGSNVEVFPLATDRRPAPFVVDANELLVQDIQLSGGLLSVNQPSLLAWVDDVSYEGTNGAYAVVSAEDGLPIAPAQWTDNGGRLEVQLTDDPSVVRVLVYGANIPDMAPFRIAMSSGNFYNSLHITGTGFVSEDKQVTIYTGAPLNPTGEAVGIEVQNRHVSSLAQAYTAGMRTARAYGAQRFSRSGSTNRFEGQSLTLVPGARLGAYRIEDTSTSFDGVSFNATIDYTIDDFNNQHPPGMTIGQFNASRPVGETFGGFNGYTAKTQFTT